MEHTVDIDTSVPSSSSPTPRTWALRRSIVPAMPHQSTATFGVEGVENNSSRSNMPGATTAAVAIDLKQLRQEMSANVRLVEALGISVEQIRKEIHGVFAKQNAKGDSDNCSILDQLFQKVSHMETTILEEMRATQIKNYFAAGGGTGGGKTPRHGVEDSDNKELVGIKSAIDDIRDQLAFSRSRSRPSFTSSKKVQSEEQAGEIGRWVGGGHLYEIFADGHCLRLKVVKDGNSRGTVLTRTAEEFLIGEVDNQRLRLKYLSASNELVISYFLSQEIWGDDLYLTKAAAHERNGVNCLGMEAQRRKMKQHVSMMMQWRERAKLANFINHKREQYGDVFGGTKTSDSWWMEVLEDIQQNQSGHALSLQEHMHDKEARKKHKLTYFYRCCIRRAKLEKLVESPCFTTFSVLFIVSNAIWIAVASNHSMQRIHNRNPPMREDWFDHVDVIFTGIFFAELVIRLLAYRVKFFFNDDWLFNWFDFAIVVISILGLMSSRFANILRVVRLMRVLRMFRAIRSLTFFSELQHYMVTLMASFKVWIWAMFFFSFCTFCTTLTVMEFLQSLGDHHDPATLQIIRDNFSDLRHAMFTVIYTATHGVLWGNLVEAHGKVLGSVQVVITVYCLLMFFMMFPIILAEYSLKVFHIRDADSNVMLQSRMEQADLFLNDFIVRCKKSGYKIERQLDVEQLDSFMKHEDIESFLMANEIFLVADEVFPIFANDGKLTVKEFVYGCQWLKTASKPTDTLFLSEQIEKLSEDVGLQKDKTKHLDRVLAEFRREFQKKWEGGESDSGDN